MTISIRVTHPSGTIDSSVYWIGFLIVHDEYLADGYGLAVNAVEIASLKLSVSTAHRVAGGFSYPMDLRNDPEHRTDRSTVSAYYLKIDDLDAAFGLFPHVREVEFAIFRKDGGTLQPLGGATVIHFHVDNDVVRAGIGDDDTGYRLLRRTFACERDGKLQLQLGTTWIRESAADGNIAAVCARLRQKQNEKRVAQQRESPAPSVPGKPAAEAAQASNAAEADSAPEVRPHVGPEVRPEVEPEPPIDRSPDTGREEKAEWRPETVIQSEGATGADDEGAGRTGEMPRREPGPGGRTWKMVVAFCIVLVLVGAMYRWKQASYMTPPKPAPTPVPNPVPATTPAPALGNASGPSAPASSSEPVFQPPPPKSRAEIYTFGYSEHLEHVRALLQAVKASNDAQFAANIEWLEDNKQIATLDPKKVNERQKFNADIEQRMRAADAKSDADELRAIAEDLVVFLQSNFGLARAHLNLALTHVLLGQPKQALPSAFHTIVFNPRGGNAWVALGLALAMAGDQNGGADGLCVALKVSSYSDNTVRLMSRLEDGQAYNRPAIRQAAHKTREVCPNERWR